MKTTIFYGTAKCIALSTVISTAKQNGDFQLQDNNERKTHFYFQKFLPEMKMNINNHNSTPPRVCVCV